IGFLRTANRIGKSVENGESSDRPNRFARSRSSLEDFLEKQPLRDRSRRLLIGFVEGFNAAQIECISAHALLRGQYGADDMEGHGAAPYQRRLLVARGRPGPGDTIPRRQSIIR